MSKITRVFQKLFGASGSAGDFGKFGSLQDGTKVNTMDPATIQALAAFDTGLAAAVASGTYKMPMEDMNSLFLLAFRQIAYIMQEGVAEWNSATTYYVGSIVKYGGLLFTSLQDDNANQNPATATAYWQIGVNGDSAAGDLKVSAQAADHGRWLICPAGGRTVSRTTYAALYAVVGVKYGPGNGSTTFNLPDPAGGKTLVTIDSGDADFNDLGKTGGEKTHQLTVAEMPSHTHQYYKATVGSPTYGGGGGYFGYDATGSAGGDGAHNNLQPYIVGGNLFISAR